MQRCGWVTNDPLYIQYHDHEWGVPVYEDQKLFEFIVLESAQAGLSWITVLRKRENYRQAFADFDPIRVARFDERKVQRLLQDAGLIRNERKIRAAINNARAFIKIQNEFRSFSDYSWAFVQNVPKINHWHSLAELPAQTQESQAFSKDLKKRGFQFVGPTIAYALMQAVGMVNDHTTDCFRHSQLCTNNDR